MIFEIASEKQREGLGAIGLAIIGFGTHIATEGFGITGPLKGLVKK